MKQSSGDITTMKGLKVWKKLFSRNEKLIIILTIVISPYQGYSYVAFLCYILIVLFYTTSRLLHIICTMNSINLYMFLSYVGGFYPFLADRTNGRAIATLLRLSSVVVCRLWRYVLWLNGAS